MKRLHIFALTFAIACAVGAPGLGAQEVDACGEGFHQFDFWIGEWTVTNQSGSSVQGQSSITSVASGCVIREQWTSGGGVGYSLNMYDPVRDDWTQVWMDDSGLELHITGGMVGNSMVMTGTLNGQLQRITWSPLSGGRVRQQWDVSNNGGQTWINTFDGFYGPK